MSMFSINHQGLSQLADDLARAGSGIAAEMEKPVRQSGRELRDEARSRARKTAGRHGKYYPASITDEVRMGDGGIFAEVGPDPDKPQGGMSFEYGSANQPPHNDINGAADVMEPKFVAAVEKAIDDLLTAHGL